jgi:hypothetical protein
MVERMKPQHLTLSKRLAAHMTRRFTTIIAIVGLPSVVFDVPLVVAGVVKLFAASWTHKNDRYLVGLDQMSWHHFRMTLQRTQQTGILWRFDAFWFLAIVEVETHNVRTNHLKAAEYVGAFGAHVFYS